MESFAQIQQKNSALPTEYNPNSENIAEQIDAKIAHQKYMENTVSVGEGEENDSVMPDGFRERRDLEQYFFTKNLISTLINSLTMRYADQEELEAKVCLVCAPSLSKAFLDQLGYNVVVCDIDTRFNDLPGYAHFDLQEPDKCTDPRVLNNQFELIIFDPPFFYITLDQMSKAIDFISKHSSNHAAMTIGMSFMTRDEADVKKSFKQFKLEKTNLALEYATVKANRWDNYGWYSNTDLPMIKRMKKKK